MPSFLFPFRASIFHFSLPFSNLCFYFVFSRFHLSYCHSQRPCRHTNGPTTVVCGHALRAMIFAIYCSLCFVDHCYLPLLSLAIKLSLSPPNCTAQFARTDTLGLRATIATELAVLLDVSVGGHLVHRQERPHKKRLIAASRRT